MYEVRDKVQGVATESSVKIDPAQLPLGQGQALAQLPGEGGLSWLLPPGEGDGLRGKAWTSRPSLASAQHHALLVISPPLPSPPGLSSACSTSQPPPHRAPVSPVPHSSLQLGDSLQCLFQQVLQALQSLPQVLFLLLFLGCPDLQQLCRLETRGAAMNPLAPWCLAAIGSPSLQSSSLHLSISPNPLSPPRSSYHVQAHHT